MRNFLEKLVYLRNKTYIDFLLEIKSLASKLNTISESASLALQGWKEALQQETSFEEYKYAKEEFIKDSSSLEKAYDKLAFELSMKVHQAEEFLYDEELDSLKSTVENDVCHAFLSWEQYQRFKDKD